MTYVTRFTRAQRAVAVGALAATAGCAGGSSSTDTTFSTDLLRAAPQGVPFDDLAPSERLAMAPAIASDAPERPVAHSTSAAPVARAHRTHIGGAGKTAAKRRKP
jgi:hypothetical protein